MVIKLDASLDAGEGPKPPRECDVAVMDVRVLETLLQAGPIIAIGERPNLFAPCDLL